MNTAKPEAMLTIDVEEHDRIEAAAGLFIPEPLKARYRARLRPSVDWLLDRLASREVRATFFVVGQVALHSPGIVKDIHKAGHEVASHSWEHRRIHSLSPAGFREDLRLSKDALEQVTGEKIVGFRAPTFSLTAETAWAIDVLVEEGFVYDSSIYPVRHDRYGVPLAPRVPFRVQGTAAEILELPPATLRVLGQNLPVGGGGYFRLLPIGLMEAGVRQLRHFSPAMLYFHPWEFDPHQPRLPLRALSRLRTYWGLYRSCTRFRDVLTRFSFTLAKDVAASLARRRLDRFTLHPRLAQAERVSGC